ncbi:MAG: hypothetical protein U0325_13570 [Polyangiales bacterium]
MDAVVTHGADAVIVFEFANDRSAERPDDQRRCHEGEDLGTLAQMVSPPPAS